MTEVWRITKERHFLKDPLSGEGARRYPGRWHPPGRAVVYTSESLSLAALEAFVHLPARRHLPSDLIAVRIGVAGISNLRVEGGGLPGGWASVFPIAATQAIGARWIDGASACGLDIPSAVIPSERNLILNPAHPEFHSVRVLGAQAFRFDPRMRS